MIQIDMPMPDSCYECRFETVNWSCKAMSYRPNEYTNYERRPEWCPLKEQEPVEPDYDPATLTWSCGNCGQTFDRCKNKFCHRCGRKVKWNE